jgi:hypothetical protein
LVGGDDAVLVTFVVALGTTGCCAVLVGCAERGAAADRDPPLGCPALF